MKYIVIIPEVHVLKVPVEAESEEEARNKVSKWLEETDGCEDFRRDNLEYSHTEDVYEWGVTVFNDKAQKID